MSRFQQSIDLSLSRASTHGVCVAAILGLQWRIAGDSEDRIACQEAVDAVSQSISPARIILSITGCSQGPTRVMLNGAAFGSGSEQRTHVRHQVELLAQMIEKGAVSLATTLAKHTGTWCSADWGAPDLVRRRLDSRVRAWPGLDGVTGTIVAVSPSAALPVSVGLAEVADHDR